MVSMGLVEPLGKQANALRADLFLLDSVCAVLRCHAAQRRKIENSRRGYDSGN